jgi:hypothetical protein
MPYDPGHEELFRWVVVSLVEGRSVAYRRARRAGKQAWDEVDQFYRRELLHELPATIDELLDSLEGSEEDRPDFLAWAEALKSQTTVLSAEHR